MHIKHEVYNTLKLQLGVKINFRLVMTSVSSRKRDLPKGVATMPTLFFLTHLLPAYHNVNRFVASFLAPISSSYRIIYCVNGAEI